MRSKSRSAGSSQKKALLSITLRRSWSAGVAQMTREDVVDQFLENQKIRLFAEFECIVPVSEASPALAIRDKIGQIIHSKTLVSDAP